MIKSEICESDTALGAGCTIRDNKGVFERLLIKTQFSSDVCLWLNTLVCVQQENPVDFLQGLKIEDLY